MREPPPPPLRRRRGRSAAVRWATVALRALLSRSYYKFGIWVAGHPATVLLLSFVFVAGFSAGLIKFQVETDPVNLWYVARAGCAARLIGTPRTKRPCGTVPPARFVLASRQVGAVIDDAAAERLFRPDVWPVLPHAAGHHLHLGRLEHRVVRQFTHPVRDPRQHLPDRRTGARWPDGASTYSCSRYASDTRNDGPPFLLPGSSRCAHVCVCVCVGVCVVGGGGTVRGCASDAPTMARSPVAASRPSATTATAARFTTCASAHCP